MGNSCETRWSSPRLDGVTVLNGLQHPARNRSFPHDGALWGSPSTEGGNFSVLVNGVIEEVPLSQMESGFYSHYFLVPKKNGGLHPILDTQRVQFQDVKAEAEIWMIGSYCPITGVSSWSSGNGPRPSEKPQAEDKPPEQCCCQDSRHLSWVWTCILARCKHVCLPFSHLGFV